MKLLLNTLPSVFSGGKSLWHALGKAWTFVFDLFEYFIFFIDWSFVFTDIFGTGVTLGHFLGLYMAWNLLKRITKKTLTLPVEIGAHFLSGVVESVLYFFIKLLFKIPRFILSQMKKSFTILRNTDYEYLWMNILNTLDVIFTWILENIRWLKSNNNKLN